MDDFYYYDDEEDDDDYPYGGNGYDDGVFDYETSCAVCGRADCLDNCQSCGAPLCHMHSELGVGFCPECPTIWYRPESIPLPLKERLHDAIKHLLIRVHCWLHPPPQINDDEIPF